MKAIKTAEGHIIPRSCAATEEQAWKQACVIDSHMMRCMEEGYRCVEVSITEAEQARPVAWMWDQATYMETDVRGRNWHPVMGKQEPTDHWMVRNVVPLYAAPPVPAGMVMVPVEPTQAMLDAGALTVTGACRGAKSCWHEMLAAAPKGEI